MKDLVLDELREAETENTARGENRPKNLVGIRTLYCICLLPVISGLIILYLTGDNYICVGKSRQKAFFTAFIPFIFFSCLQIIFVDRVNPLIGGIWNGAFWVIVDYALSVLLSFLLVLVHKIYLKKALMQKYSNN
jgi:hypothetical protein